MSTAATFTDLVNLESHKVKPDAMGASECGPGCVVEVASDRNALIEALAEYGLRALMEDGRASGIYGVYTVALERLNQKIADELRQRKGK